VISDFVKGSVSRSHEGRKGELTMRILRPTTLVLWPFFLVAACGGSTEKTPAPGGPSTGSDVHPVPVDLTQVPSAAYDASKDGFVVHEWGTLTSVMGSDGAIVTGLHHEEEDLPAFVADRMAQAKLDPSITVKPTNEKMETPVTYFYAPTPITVQAKVGFPNGIFTQWFPYVHAMSPAVFAMDDGSFVDRYTQDLGTIPSKCQPYFDADYRNGLLDWATVQVLPREESVALPGGIEKTTWGFARNTAANPLTVSGQNEKFLFYRGLGNFELPLTASFVDERPVLHNGDATNAMKGLFLMNVTADAASFAELDDVPAGGALKAEIPTASMSHDAFVAALKTKLAARLVRDGLYTDEAVAMVDTWEHSYFLTPGVRLLYLLPQAHTDRIIPLTITPAPSVLARTMVIRVELMTPAYEKQLGGWLHDLATGSADAKARFLGLGRFAEPHLGRAIALSHDAAEKAAGDALLTEVRAQRKWAPATAE
jgi:hypothetical protein